MSDLWLSPTGSCLQIAAPRRLAVYPHMTTGERWIDPLYFFCFFSCVFCVNSSRRTRRGVRRIGFTQGWISTRAAFPRRKKWPARTPTRLPGCLSNTHRWAWAPSQEPLRISSYSENIIKRTWYVVETRKETHRGAGQRRKVYAVCTPRRRPSCLQLRSAFDSHSNFSCILLLA